MSFHDIREKPHIISKAVEKYELDGSAKRVPDEEIVKLNPIWYLPHHAVFHHPRSNEPIVVFDCAATSDGTSLNTELLQGPGNTSTLSRIIFGSGSMKSQSQLM